MSPLSELRPIPRPLAIVALLLLAVALAPVTASAQRVLGIGEDASLPRRGKIRVTVKTEVTGFDERYSRSGDGTVDPLGADFTTDSLGIPQFRGLRRAQESIRAIAQLPGFELSLGKLNLQLDGRVERLPLTVELGVLSRLAVSLTVPIVRTRTTVVFGPGLGKGATVGLNPAVLRSAALMQDTALVNAFRRAVTDLNERLRTCMGSAEPRCQGVNSDRAGAQALATSSGSFLTDLASVYLGSFTVPLAGSTAHTSIASRISSFESRFQSYGVTALANARPPAGAAPLSHDEFQRLLTDSAVGLRVDPLATTQRTGLGDLEVGAKFLLFNTIPDPGASARRFGMRLALGGVFRLPTGKADVPSSMVDIGLGDGQADVEAHGFVDVALGRHASVSAAARYVNQLADDPVLRIPDYPGQPFLGEWRERRVRRDLGNLVSLDLTPRWAFNEFFSVAGLYALRRKEADRHRGEFEIELPVDPAEGTVLAASVLDEGTAFTEHRAGFGIAFSNAAAFARGKARFPYELSYVHLQTTSARRGLVPKVAADRVQVRVYMPLFGR